MYGTHPNQTRRVSRRCLWACLIALAGAAQAAFPEEAPVAEMDAVVVVQAPLAEPATV